MTSRRGYLGNIRAPEFPPDAEWLNTDHPLSLAALRGKFVLLDFWTYGCINCLHVIPDLRRLEKRFSSELVVIGVHSAKFANESQSANLRQVIMRYGIEHPVVNDASFAVWQAYVVRAWPTAILIDPEGRVIASHSGEGIWNAFADLLADAVVEYDARDAIDRTPVSLALERNKAPDTALSFPGKVLADENQKRLYIADTGHHRIVVADLTGAVLEVIGSGAAGFTDGDYESVRFRQPQGMAVYDGMLYVADTGNHAIRTVALSERMVSTLVGDGQQGRLSGSAAFGEAKLSSPWDIVALDDTLYVAMAGVHQLWAFDLTNRVARVHAGSGREGILDAPLGHATLAQPSGITTDGECLYFADSEASAVRRADLSSAGKVSTIIGEGLFDFGDVDGAWPEARLQHALGIAYHEGKLYVADTYNHKIKEVDPGASKVVTLVGNGRPGWRDGRVARFYEPGGVSVAGGRLYVADTNNHGIRVVALDGREVTTLSLADPQGRLVNIERDAGRMRIRLPEQVVRPGEGILDVQIELPAGHKLNDTAPSHLEWRPVSESIVLAPEYRTVDLVGTDGIVSVPVALSAGRDVLRGDVALYYCRTAQAQLCLIYIATIEVPVHITAAAASSTIHVPITVKATPDRQKPDSADGPPLVAMPR